MSGVTRADVAALAGVSPAVVSYVVNGGPRAVAAATRIRVEAAVAELGYRPDPLANAFRDRRSRTVGLLVPSPLDPYAAELAVAVAESLRRQGHALSIAIASASPQRDVDQVRAFADQRMAGVLLASGALLPPGVDLSGIDVVALDATASFAGPAVGSDDAHGVAIAVAHLIGHARRRIACVSGPASSSDGAQRVQGWRDAVRGAGLDADAALIVHADVSAAGGARAARALLAGTAEPPDAVFVGSDAQAIGFLRAAADLGVGVPCDLAVVSYDGTAAARHTAPRLTTLRRPIREIADRAVARLLTGAPSDGAPASPAVRGSLVIGESCGCATRSDAGAGRG